VNATDRVMKVLADEGLLSDVPRAQEYRISSRITAALVSPCGWDASVGPEEWAQPGEPGTGRATGPTVTLHIGGAA
jgi:hypothetical protein